MCNLKRPIPSFSILLFDVISQATISRIFDAVHIEEVIGDFVQLKKAGSNFKGLSPWTNEKTPSFFVSPSKGIFKDFSSGKGGNAVSFLMELENMTYPEALRYLAGKYGIEVEETEVSKEQAEEVSLRESLALVNDFAFEHFRQNLWESEEGRSVGLSYFREREFSDATIETFGLGYAPDQRDALLKAAVEAGHNEEHMGTLGLIKQGEYGAYDFFRARVIFPIRNVSGRNIAFAGRTLRSDNKVKYLNSPESPLYEKSRVLYGIYEGKRSIVQKNHCLLVEGYTDVISLHQAGLGYAVASSGTALTREQVLLIKRFTSNVSILYDSDSAGIKAAMRAIDLMLQEGVQARVVLFPTGQDPDSYARAVSQDELETFIEEEAVDFIDFFTKVMLPDGADSEPIKKAEAVRRMVESLALVKDQIVRSTYVEKCSRQLGIAAQVIHNEINKIIRREQRRQAIREERESDLPLDVLAAPPQEGPPKADESIYEREIARVLLTYGNKEISIELEPEEEEGDESEELHVPLAEYVLHELFTDGIDFYTPAYRKIVEVFRERFEAQGSFPDVNYFVNDHELSPLVAELISEPYELSENWEAKYHIYTESEEENLKQTAFDPLMRLKLKRVMHMISELELKIKDCSEVDELHLLLLEKIRLDRLKVHLSSYFGTAIL